MAFEFSPEVDDYFMLHTRIGMRDFFVPNKPPILYEHFFKKRSIDDVLVDWKADRALVEKQNKSDIANHLKKYPTPTFDPFGLFDPQEAEVKEDASITV
jgi:hypothetical protein